MTKGTPQALLSLLVCILLILQACGARQLVQVDGSNDGSTGTAGPTEAQLADAIKVISTINDPTTPEDIRVVVGEAKGVTAGSLHSSCRSCARQIHGRCRPPAPCILGSALFCTNIPCSC